MPTTLSAPAEATAGSLATQLAAAAAPLTGGRGAVLSFHPASLEVRAASWPGGSVVRDGREVWADLDATLGEGMLPDEAGETLALPPHPQLDAGLLAAVTRQAASPPRAEQVRAIVVARASQDSPIVQVSIEQDDVATGRGMLMQLDDRNRPRQVGATVWLPLAPVAAPAAALARHLRCGGREADGTVDGWLEWEWRRSFR